ncbi:MAG: hypothetical protein GX079_01515 [Tissierellia bacterium]|nr:hypothetical protein [Tissierellia bacterium]
MKKRINLYELIKSQMEDNLFLSILILLLGLNQLVYSYIPGALLLNLLLLGFIFQAYNTSNKKTILLIGALALLGLFGLGISTEFEFLRESIYSLAVLWITVGLISFTLKKENFLEEFYFQAFRLALALVYFTILYVAIYLISFLIDQIFFLNLPYDGLIFRMANSLASMLGLFVLFSKRQKVAMGGFFQPLFKKILPKLSLILGALALVYHLQILLGFIEVYYSGVFYLFMGLFFFAYLLSFWGEEDSKEKSIILVFFMALSLLHILVKADIFSRVQVSYTSRGLYHDLLASLAFIVYGLVLLKDKKRLGDFRWLAVFLSLLLFLPPLGYSLYDRYGFDEMATKSPSILAEFSLSPGPAEPQDNDYVSFYSFRESGRIEDISDYNYLYDLYFQLEDEEDFSDRDIEISMVDEGRKILVVRGSEEETIDMYSIAKEDFDQKKYVESPPKVFEALGLKLIIYDYSYSNNHYYIELRVLAP